jgi:HEPN domain-containing protein
MDNEKINEIKRWLTKSQHDLSSAIILMEGDEKYPDISVYHCQQAAEKAIKAYLIYQDIVFEKTHNLVALLSDCINLDSRFEQWKNVALILTPYATDFRYPRETMEPTKEEAQEAIIMTKAIVDFIIKLLPDEATP